MTETDDLMEEITGTLDLKPADDTPFKAALAEQDNWKHRSKNMRCRTCRFFVEKQSTVSESTTIGRCRCHAPTLQGWPVMFLSDWCGDHKLDEEKI